MKKILILILSLFVMFCSSEKDTLNPKSGIKTETISKYNFEEEKFGEYISVCLEKKIYKYDSNGNKVEESDYDSEGSLNWKYIYKYDTKNRIVELIKYNFGLKFGQLQQTLTEKYIYEYEEY